jgi:signal transduction histidine kinase
MSEPAGGLDEDNSEVEHGKTRLLFRNAGVGQAVTVANASILLFILENTLSHVWALGWWLVAVSVAAARFLLARRFQSAAEEQQREHVWRRQALNGAMLAGSVWGLGAVGFMLADGGSGRMFAALVMSGMVAGAVPILSSVPAAFRAYALPIVFCVVLTPLLDYRSQSDMLLVMVSVLFLLAMLRSARFFHDSLDQSLRAEIAMRGVAQRLEQARAAAEMASAAKSQFLGNMSHELRTPLNGVLGMADLLALTRLDAEQHGYLASLQGEAQRLHRMVEDTLDLAELDAGKVSPRVAPFVLDETLQSALQPYAQAAAAKGLAWELAIAPDLRLLRQGDALRWRQALLKLVDNAVKFTAAGTVKVGLGETADGQVVVSVSDTGIGMTPAQCEAVLTDYTQADATATRRFEGLGIGLTLTRRIVALLRGRLEVDSAPGRGTTIRLVVPLPPA